jgi:phosphosulfolactate synthase
MAVSFDDIPVTRCSTKPRTSGLTIMIDPGYSYEELFSTVTSHGEYLDIVKLGFGTARVNHILTTRKVEMLSTTSMEFCFGGTLAEDYIKDNLLGVFLDKCRAAGCTYVEISNGSFEPLTSCLKSKCVRRAAEAGFKVLAEVGYKTRRLTDLSPTQWVEAIQLDLEAGATFVLLESRESGLSGIADKEGNLDMAIIEPIIAAGFPLERLIFEAATKKLQVELIKKFGCEVNLANINRDDLQSLQTLRMYARGDTFNDRVSGTQFDPDHI